VPTSASEPHFPARFNPDAFDEDLAHSTPAGRTAAIAARREYETGGVPFSHLKPCEPVGRDGTELPDCAKVYVPHPNGKWGMVFHAFMVDRKVHLHCLAFGVRHHPDDSHALDVYKVAARRLNA
jgi:hypothetical protein